MASSPDTPGAVAPGPLFAERAEPAQLPSVRKPLGWFPVAATSALVGLGLWGAWVTRELTTVTDAPQISRIQLSSMVGEYVQAQARSATPPEQVTAETKAFMSEIERNLKARGAKGQIVLVGEAVLAGDVPDITAEVRRQVFTKVRMPQPAPQTAQSVMGAMQQAMADPSLAGNVNGLRN